MACGDVSSRDHTTLPLAVFRAILRWRFGRQRDADAFPVYKGRMDAAAKSFFLNGNAEEIAAFVRDQLDACLPNVDVELEGATITLTMPASEMAVLSAMTSPDDGVTLKYDTLAREPCETWGDYAMRVGAAPPGEDRVKWMEHLQLKAGE